MYSYFGCQYLVRIHGAESQNSDDSIQAKLRGCNIWHFWQMFQLVTNWTWVIYTKRSVTFAQISVQKLVQIATGY